MKLKNKVKARYEGAKLWTYAAVALPLVAIVTLVIVAADACK